MYSIGKSADWYKRNKIRLGAATVINFLDREVPGLVGASREAAIMRSISCCIDAMETHEVEINRDGKRVKIESQRAETLSLASSCLRNVAACVDRSFPGYAEDGMLGLVFTRRSSSPTPSSAPLTFRQSAIQQDDNDNDETPTSSQTHGCGGNSACGVPQHELVSVETVVPDKQEQHFLLKRNKLAAPLSRSAALISSEDEGSSTRRHLIRGSLEATTLDPRIANSGLDQKRGRRVPPPPREDDNDNDIIQPWSCNDPYANQ